MNDDTNSKQLDGVVDTLRAATKAQRVTLRRNIPGNYEFPVTNESLSPETASLKHYVELPQQTGPTYKRIGRTKSIVVISDCNAAIRGGEPEFTDGAEYFSKLMSDYGDMQAFIAIPVYVENDLESVISVHSLGAPRDWTTEDRHSAERAQTEAATVLASIRNRPAQV